jgi:hypothetical protein
MSCAWIIVLLVNFSHVFNAVRKLFCAGLKPAAFAALVPNSANKPLYELIEEITGDHEMLVGVYF